MASHELKIVLGILEEVAVKFKQLYEDADVAIAGGNTKAYKDKLAERAQLIVELPSKVAISVSTLKGGEEKLCLVIREKLASFAYMAKRAIDADNEFGMGVLLTSKGHKESEKNYLEKMIDHVKELGGIMTKDRQLEIALKILGWQYRRMGTEMFMCELQLAAEDADIPSEEMLEFFKSLSDEMMKEKEA